MSWITPPGDLVQGCSPEFTRFAFSGDPAGAQALNRYLWYHFSSRMGNGRTLFNKEYLTTADLWVSGATDERRAKSIQAVHREDLLAIELDDEGYVKTHQHFSHAHDDGWPFPLWPQVPGGEQGITAGWHFQEDGPDWMWIWPMLKKGGRLAHYGTPATRAWELVNLRSEGIVDGKWRLVSTGPSPAIISPATVVIDAFNAPFLQLRYKRSGQPPLGVLPYLEWMREGDSEFGSERRVYFQPEETDHSGVTGTRHAILAMYRHPQWQGRIERMRISLAPGESDVTFDIDSFFTVYDTRHTINNPIYILSCWNYFRWTGDIDFLRRVINRMRTALRYQQTELGGLAVQWIRNPWVGHDGRSAMRVNPDGTKTFRPGHGIGNNYWDLLPFGGDDFYATAQYYAATLVMADVEDAVRQYPGWELPRGALALDPDHLRAHAVQVKQQANQRFWDAAAGRFVACIDADGIPHDYGFTFLNLDAIWYGIASDEHAQQILSWLCGERTVPGDTSTGADIYHWRFGPRATTRRNVEWYGQGWTSPEAIAWGGQVQDGGAVLGFSFYDLWARLIVRGPDNAWQRLTEILAWEDEVWAAGGYREYYKDGKQGTTLQGCGTAGGIGVDCEFFESSLVPSIVVYGFLGMDPAADRLRIAPRLPSACPAMAAHNLLYHGMRMNVQAATDEILIELKDPPQEPIEVELPGAWVPAGGAVPVSRFVLNAAGTFAFRAAQ